VLSEQEAKTRLEIIPQSQNIKIPHSGEFMEKVIVEGPPEMIDLFLNDFRTYTGGDRKFMPIAVQLEKKRLKERDGEFIISGVILTPPPSIEKKEVIDFFIVFLDVVNLTALKKIRQQGAV
jgi:hypothetical protein